MPEQEQGDETLARLQDDVCRATAVPAFEIRAEGDGEGMPVLEGHFSTFNDWYEINSFWEGQFLERIAPGAFKRTFNASRNSKDSHRIQVLLEHGFDPTVGDKPLGTPTTLEEDSEGARYEVQLFDTSYNRDLVPALDAGVYRSSFRFGVIKDEWNQDPGTSDHNPQGLPERTIKEVRVAEFGPTLFPANPSASAGLRSTTDEYYEKLRERNPKAYDDFAERTSKVRSLPISTEGDKDGAPEAELEETVEDSRDKLHSTDSNEVELPESSLDHSEDSRTDSHSDAEETTPSDKESTENMDTERMTVSARRSRVTEIDARLKEIDQEYDGNELTSEARSEWESLVDERVTHESAIADDEARKEQLAALAGTEAESRATERAKLPRTKTPGAKPVRRIENVYDLEAYRREARNMDDLAVLYNDGAKRAIEESTIPGYGVDEAKAKETVRRLVETIDDDKASLARRILVTGSPTYRRAFGKAVMKGSDAGLSTEERAALAAGAGATGGFAVPFELDPTLILTSDGSINPLRQISRVVQITTSTWQGVTSGNVAVSRAGEAQEATDGAPTLAQPEATPTRVQGFVPFSIEIDQDWNALQSEMTMLLQEAKDDEEADSFVNGDGTGNNPAGVVQTLAASSEVAGDLTSSTVYDLEEALPPRFRARGRFLANKAIYNTIRQFASSDGHALWERVGNGQPPELLGYPAHEASEMTTDGVGLGSRYLLFGDFSKFVIVDRVGMNVELIPHLFGTTANFPTGQRGIYAIWRNTSLVLVDNAFRVAEGV